MGFWRFLAVIGGPFSSYLQPYPRQFNDADTQCLEAF